MSEWLSAGPEMDPLQHVRELVTEHAALRQVATLVARESTPEQLFAVVAKQVARVFDVPHVRLVRYESDGSVVVGGYSEAGDEPFPPASRWPIDGRGVVAAVRQTGRPARVDDGADLPAGMHSAVASPIVVAGRLWGTMVVHCTRLEPLPKTTEARLTDFTELVASAIADAGSRIAIGRLADEQAALRSVATLVAEGEPPAGVFSAVCEAVGRLLEADMTGMLAFPGDGTATTMAFWSTGGPTVPVGAQQRLAANGIVARILSTGAPARRDDYAEVGRDIGELANTLGQNSTVGAPIRVGGRVWGVLMAATRRRAPWAAEAEGRLAEFTELVATAIANAESREARVAIADEQAALRRVATLVAKEDLPEKVFAKVAEETGRLLGGVECTLLRNDRDGVVTNVGSWGEAIATIFPLGASFHPEGDGVAATVLHTGQPHRIDDYSGITDPIARSARDRGIESSVGCPIVVRGAIWGALVVGTTGADPFAPGAETRLTQFADLVATAVANAEARGEIVRLADEQAALRRVATLVARDAAPGEVFDAVAMEVGKLFETDITVVGRYDGGGAATAIGSWSASPGGVPVGTRSAVGGRNVLSHVARTESPSRVDRYDDASGEAADIARCHGWRSSIAAPIIVEGRLWGVMLVATQRPEPFAAGAEEQLAAFTDLVATALANAQAHDEVLRFGEEQAALGRVATLVAAGAAPEAVFTAVAAEAASLLTLDWIELVRYDGDTTGTVIAASGEHPFPAGSAWSLDDPSVMATVARTARAARIDDYRALEGEIARAARGAAFQSAIGAPLTVEGRLWGVIIAISTDPEPIPERSEARLCQFTELVATAVANAEARQALERVAVEQAALRRVATLVAEGADPDEIFAAVGDEIGRLFGSSITTVGRFEPDAQALVAVAVGTGTVGVPIGSRWELDDLMASAAVFRTGQSARVDAPDWSAGRGRLAQVGHRLGIASTVASPIFVEGRLWGVVTVSDHELLPQAAEERLEKFSELVATAIANADNRSELAASRRRIVAAADEARRRIERDLHDGIQQRLIALTFRARAMLRKPPAELPRVAAELSEGLKDVSDELREVSRGIHPTILTEAGLGPALRALARRSNVPIDVDVRVDQRLPAPVEAAAYYIASEALANVAKHSRANVVELIAADDDGVLTLEVRDDGIGGAGAGAGRGSGILGLTDRVEALGGTISIVSPPRGGTKLSVRLPTTT